MINNNKNPRHTTRDNRHSQRGNQNKRSLGSTLFSVIALIAVAVYFFGDLSSGFLTDSIDSTTVSQTSSEAQPAKTSGVTGDAQIDNTIALIQRGGPFPYPHKDGTTFYNREVSIAHAVTRLLPRIYRAYPACHIAVMAHRHKQRLSTDRILLNR